MTVLGKIGFWLFAIIAIATLEYEWILVGLAIGAVDLVIWIWRNAKYSPTTTSKPTKKTQWSDHFIYYNLFEDKNRRK